MVEKTFKIQDYLHYYCVAKSGIKEENRDNIPKSHYADQVRHIKKFLLDVFKSLELSQFFSDYCEEFDDLFSTPWDDFFKYVADIFQKKVKDSVQNSDAKLIRTDLRKTNLHAKKFLGESIYNELLNKLVFAVINNDIDGFVFTNRLLGSKIYLANTLATLKNSAIFSIDKYFNTLLDEKSLTPKEKVSRIQEFNLSLQEFIKRFYMKDFKLEFIDEEIGIAEKIEFKTKTPKEKIRDSSPVDGKKS